MGTAFNQLDVPTEDLDLYALPLEVESDEDAEPEARPAWRPSYPPGVSVVRRRVHEAFFARMIDLPGPRLAIALQTWWRAAQHGEEVDVDDHLRLGAPRRGAGEWSVPGHLRRPGSLRWVPVEVFLWPYLDRWTRLVLQPRGAVRPVRRYFRAGNRSLDVFTELLAASCRGVPSVP